MRYTTPAIDMDIDSTMSKVLQEQVIPKGIELDEAAQVHTKEYSWGKLKTVQAGNAASVVLHPEHHKAIGALKDGESHDFQDETRTKWKAARKGDNVHFTTDKISGKIVAKHAHIAEEVEQIDELSGATLGSYIQKAHADIRDRQARAKDLEAHPKVAAARAKFLDTVNAGKGLWKKTDVAKNYAARRKASDKLQAAKDEVDPNRSKSADTARKRHAGLAKAIDRLTSGKKLTEEQQAILDELMIVAEQMDLEESQQIDEAFFNHRTAGSHGIIHRDSAARFYKTGEHVDFYDHGTGDKQHGKVTKNDGKEVHILHAGKTKKYKLSNTYPGHGVTEQLDLEETQQIDEALSPDNPVSRATADLHAALKKAAEKAAKLFDVSKGAAYTLLKAHGSNAPGNIDPSRYKESFRGEEEYRAMIKFTSGVELKVQPAIEQAAEQLRALSKKL